MSWYARREVSTFSKDVVLYTLKDSPSANWYYRIKLHGEKRPYLQRSTKTDSFEKANEVALVAWQEVGYRAKQGIRTLTPTIEQAYKSFVEERAAPGSRRKYLDKWNLYFSAYFRLRGRTNPDAITAQDFNNYPVWRRHDSYEHYNQVSRRPDLRKRFAEVHRTTMRDELYYLRRFLKWCVDNDYMRSMLNHQPIATLIGAGRFGEKRKFSNHISKDTAKKIRDRLKEYKDSKTNNIVNDWSRVRLWYYYNTVGRACIRPGTESQNLRWKDIHRTLHKRYKKHYYRVLVKGKLNKPRWAILPLQYTHYIDEWRTFYEENRTTDTPIEECYVWGNYRGEHQDLNSLGRLFAKTLGDIRYEEEQPITLYSLRGAEINNRLFNLGMPPAEVAVAAGTSIQYIVQNYMSGGYGGDAQAETLDTDIYDRMYASTPKG